MAGVRTRPFGWLAVDRIRHDRGLRVLTAVAMVGFVVLVYVLVVVGGGALVGHTGAPSLWLSVVATAIVAFAFEPVRTNVNVGSPERCTRIGCRRIKCCPTFR